MKKLAFISVLVLILFICFTVSAFAGDFYVIPVQKQIEIIPKTGQTSCWNASGETITCTGTGQDGEHQMGITPAVPPSSSYTVQRFTDNSDGTVRDNLTGLIWLKQANYKNTSGETGTVNWTDALGFCNTLQSGQCGLTDGSVAGDWRLPNLNELRSLVDKGRTAPALPYGHPFIGVVTAAYRYWSSTTYADITGNAWLVNMSNGDVTGSTKVNVSYVWPVRSDN